MRWYLVVVLLVLFNANAEAMVFSDQEVQVMKDSYEPTYLPELSVRPLNTLVTQDQVTLLNNLVSKMKAENRISKNELFELSTVRMLGKKAYGFLLVGDEGTVMAFNFKLEQACIMTLDYMPELDGDLCFKLKIPK